MSLAMSKIKALSISSLFATAILPTIFDQRRLIYREFEGETEIITEGIEAYSEGINSVLFSESGEINYTLQAENQVHFKNGNTKINKPLIRLFKNKVPRWNIVANEGELMPSTMYPSFTLEENILRLSGNVELLGLDKFGNRVFISTELLEIDPVSDTLRTDQLVEYETTNIQHSSIGMFADLQDEEIIFDSSVRGFYEQISN